MLSPNLFQEAIPAFCLNRTPKSTTLAFASEEYLQEIQVTSLMKPDENYIVIDGQGNVIDLVDEAGNGTTATEDFLGQLSLSALQGMWHRMDMPWDDASCNYYL